MKTINSLFIALALVLCTQGALASKFDLKMACKVAGKNMGKGNGATVYFPNGRTLTSSAGTTGATWYCPNGRTLTSSMGSPGATFYHCNGRTFSSGTGNDGATWYFSNGRTITSSGPKLTPQEMANLACELILDSEE